MCCSIFGRYINYKILEPRERLFSFFLLSNFCLKSLFYGYSGWWHNGCGSVNLNGVNANSQLNAVNPVVAYHGIIWYPFYATLTGRGASLEADGGSWASFKATEMKIFANDVTTGNGKVILKYYLARFCKLLGLAE